MIPLRDNIRTVRRPVLPYVIIGVTGLVFVGQLLLGDVLIVDYAMIPADVLDSATNAAAIPDWLTLGTCVFLHGGFLHFLGNMWFLHIFGDNVEDCFGRIGFVVFYLVAGVLASATHLFTNVGSVIPTVGASGAIAGVMGAYVVLYPRARVLTLVPLGFYFRSFEIPAWIFLGIWFGLQFLQGVLTIGDTKSAGVAWWAHIGGFVVGAFVAFALTRTGLIQVAGQVREPPPRVSRRRSFRR